jgi:hypothetical protein
MTHPTAPQAIAVNATSDPAAGSTAPCTATDAAANAGIHVHIAYSSHMCPRYPAIASLTPRLPSARPIA